MKINEPRKSWRYNDAHRGFRLFKYNNASMTLLLSVSAVRRHRGKPLLKRFTVVVYSFMPGVSDI